MASFFKFSSDKPDVEAQKPKQQTTNENESCFPQLSYKERLIGFGMCYVLGLLISFLSFMPKNSIYVTAVLYSIGNIISLTGTSFLVGFKKQFKNMKDKTRAITSAIFFASLIMTFISVFLFKSRLLFLSFFWYSLSYIPYGRTLFKKCVESCLKA